MTPEVVPCPSFDGRGIEEEPPEPTPMEELGLPRASSVRGMDFSEALRAVKDGQKITRKGWNGPDQWVAMSPGFQLSEERVFSEPIRHALVAAGEPGNFLPYLMLRTAQGDYVPWLASQTDLLAEDWALA